MGKTNQLSILFFLLLCINLSFARRFFFDRNDRHPNREAHLGIDWSVTPKAAPREAADKESSSASIVAPKAAPREAADNESSSASAVSTPDANASAETDHISVHDVTHEANDEQINGAALREGDGRWWEELIAEVPKPPPE